VSRWLDPVREALDGVEEPVTVFFRDDDAGWRDDRLLALLDLFARHAVPIDVAAIPLALDRCAAAELRARAEDAPELVGIHQHGYAHANHEPAGRRCEFGPSRSRASQRRDLEAGARRLADMVGPPAVPIFTPPWNRCTAVTGSCLVELAFACLSRDSTAPPLAAAGLLELPIGVDWLAHSHGVRLTRPELGELLAARIRAGGTVGVMLHHAPMDAHELGSLDRLLGLLAAHDAVRCRPMAVLLAAEAVR
jgi:peptidoglycan/xylan/chitin deacetylase (PgdA/CDA1 family)